MFGLDIYDEAQRGIIPRACTRIFSNWDDKPEVESIEIHCSMLEIYKENLRDLLIDEQRDLKILETPQKGVYVDGLAEMPATSEEEIMYWIEEGESRRVWAETRYNSVSSRSHAIFIIAVT